MPRRPSITIVGVGSLGSALAVLLTRAGYRVRELVVRQGSKSAGSANALARKLGAAVTSLEDAKLDADILWLCVPDDTIAECAKRISRRGTGARTVFHSSGALSSDMLAPLRKRGLVAAAVHPLMSFVAGKPPSLQNVLFAVEGDRVAAGQAQRIARELGGLPFLIQKSKKPLYHAFGAFTSPLLVAHFSAAASLAEAAGVPKAFARKAMRPIIQRTLENYLERGGAGAFSGPLVRGDVETIRKHLKALRPFPSGLNLYVSLVRQALESLPVSNPTAIKRLLKPK